jgi:hypothetical protein
MYREYMQRVPQTNFLLGTIRYLKRKRASDGKAPNSKQGFPDDRL